MAGRKSTPEPTFFNMLLGKLGLGAQPAVQKKRRKRVPRAEDASHATDREDANFSLDEDVSPFAVYGAQSGLMERDTPEEPMPPLSYAEAQAAGFAPPPPLAPPPTLNAPPAPATPPPAGGRLFQEDALDSSLDALFSGLESGAGQPPPAPIPQVSGRTSAAAPFDEFGLSSASPIRETPPTPANRVVHAPIVTPVMPVSPVTPTAPAVAPTRPARQPTAVPTHGAFSPVVQAPVPEGLLPLAHGVNLPGLMADLARGPGAQGALLVGYDGLLIAAHAPEDVDVDFLGAQAGTLFAHNDSHLGKLQRGPLRRMLLETSQGAMLVTAADMGILVVVSRSNETLDVAAVVATLQQTLGTNAAE